MSTARLQMLRDAAVSQRLLPPHAQVPAQDTRPWPAVLLMALGAWLAALPLLGVVGLLFGDLLQGAVGPYAVGLLLLAGALVVLRSEQTPLFVEQLAVPAVLVGLLSLGWAFFRDLPAGLAAALLALLVLALGWAVRRAWMRAPLGAAGALLWALAFSPHGDPWAWQGGAMLRYGLAWQGGVLIWLAALALQGRALAGAAATQAAAALEALAAGWLLACLAGLAWWAGSSFLVSGVLGGGVVGEIGRLALEHRWQAGRVPLLQGLSVLLAACALALAARAWPGQRKPWLALAGLVPVLLAGFMPALGALLLALAACAITARWRLAAAAGLAAAWVIGAFYYQLAWPLAQKAVVLALAGALLGALAWWPARRAFAARDEAAAATAAPPRWARAGLAAGALLVLAVANLGIWQKESLIAHGQPVFVDLAPRDPRSLMQGDYMALNFRLGVDTTAVGLMSGARPRVVARRDAQGVATVLRLHQPGGALAADELLIELAPKGGRWTLVTDAWFFREGEAERWAAARYGEFRVAPDGRALLVGLRGVDLKPL
jgi:uncharacterized membrane-anchored protein